MAGYWIKFDTSTPDKPEVWAIAERLDIDPDAVVGKLLRVWAWFDDHTEKGNAPSVTKALLDRRVGVTGFCDAMVFVGWLLEEGDAISVPNFDRHNGATAKSRGLTAKRVANHKAGNAQGNAKGNGASVSDALPRAEEKRAEITHTHTHKKTTSRGTQPTVPEDLAVCWSRWIEYHFAKHGQAVPAIQAETILMDLSRRGPEKAARDIEFSIRKDAKSILDSDNDFEKRTPSAGYATKQPRKRNYE
jgi:hypothetical protein